MKTLRIEAPAKVNYRLDVLGKRPDGYHDLRMIMQRIDLCDVIDIVLTDSPEIRVTCGKAGVPDGPGNIAWRAADTLRQLSDRKPGIDIRIDKRIPVAAGMGGGSSDGAAVLMGVNELLGLGLSDQRLMEIGVTLGADVPFFIFKTTALAEGIGERLSPIGRIPAAWLTIVNPNVHVSTAWVYQNLQLTTGRDENIIPRLYESIADVCAILSNDLESVTVKRHPIIAEIKEQLLRAGACGALMSGSGPTVFGLFEKEEDAHRAARELARNTGWFTAAVRTL
ncbi:MAG TPA: 4-(cytidine 5'-diphospho)-2-C-methyl-D-erythritol kinase [Geobacteraceae bacterium]|nr:4-(cytidine 5'-diphospho)-2-C-methyl-D-erythritol kinase [Geobacteraceae bacterium]